jgi:hypothetical protein
MNGVRCPVGRKTRRALDALRQPQKDRAGFEPFRGFVSSMTHPNIRPQSNQTLDSTTPRAGLKPGAVGSVTMQRFGRAEVFALPASSDALRP